MSDVFHFLLLGSSDSFGLLGQWSCEGTVAVIVGGHLQMEPKSLSKHGSFTVGAVRLSVQVQCLVQNRSFRFRGCFLTVKVVKETYHVSTSLLSMWHFETSSPNISTPAVDRPKWDVNRELQECKTPAPLTKPMRVGTNVLFVCNRSCVDEYLSICMRTKVHR